MKIRRYLIFGLLVLLMLMVGTAGATTVIRNGSSGWINTTVIDGFVNTGGNIYIDNQNRIANSGFETITSNWTILRANWNNTNVYSGTYSMELNYTTDYAYALGDCFVLNPSTLYNFSEYSYSNGSTLDGQRAYFRTSASSVCSGTTDVVTLNPTSNNVWHLNSGTYINPSSPYGTIFLYTYLSGRHIYYDNLSLIGNKTNSNVTTYIDFGSGRQTSLYTINLTGNYSVYDKDNTTGTFVEVAGSPFLVADASTWNNQTITPSIKYQFPDVRVQLLGNATTSPELIQVAITDEVSTSTIPPVPSFVSNSIGSDYINHTWQAGSGVITDSYNVSHNGSWDNGTSNTSYNSTGLAAGDWSNITVWSWNNTGSGNLSIISISNNSQIPTSDSPSGCSAINATTYNVATNTISMHNQTSTLCTLFYDLNNISVLSYNNATNTYTLKAHILNDDIDSANFTMNDTNLIINGYNITTFGDMNISNIIISNGGGAGTFWNIYIYNYQDYNGVLINNSHFTGGRISFRPPGYDYATPSYPSSLQIKNSEWFDTNILLENTEFNRYQTGVYNLVYGSDFAISDNLTFDNITISGTGYDGIISFMTSGQNTTTSNITIINSNVSDATEYGMVHYYGLPDYRLNTFFSDFNFTNNNRGFVGGKEWGNIKITNGTLKNTTGKTPLSVFTFYRSYDNVSDRWHKSKYWIWNMTISNFSQGLFNYGYQDSVLVDFYNASVDNITTMYRMFGNVNSNASNTFFVTNVNLQDIGTMYNWAFAEDRESIREYELTDILVHDTLGNPVSGATITFTTNGTDTHPYLSINYTASRYMPDGITLGQPNYSVGLQNLSSTTTDADGHTPLPDEDRNRTVILLRHYQNKTYSGYYNYTITVSKAGYTTNNTTVITPLSTWYRPDPNSYQNTTTIVLEAETPESDYIPPNATALSQTNASGNGFWINQTWLEGTENTNVTDSYVIQINGSYANSSLNYSNTTVSDHGWKNVTVWAYNSSGNGTVSNASISLNTQIQNNPPAQSTIGNQTVNESTLLTITMSSTDADSDPLTYGTNATNGSLVGNVFTWTPTYNESGTYTWYFNTTDNLSSVDTETIIVTVNDMTPTPPEPINLANATGNYYVNYTWSAGSGNVTDSYNVSQNNTWINGTTLTYNNSSVGASGWSNITVCAYNNSGTGYLSSCVGQNTQAPAAFTPSNNIISCPIGWCYLAMNYTNKTLLQLDAMFTTDIVQGWYNSSTQKFESHSTYSSNQNVNVTQKSGYYYYFKTATNVNVNITENPSITLKSGWNLVGNMDTNRTISELETSIGGTVVTSSHWNNTEQQWKNNANEIVPVGEPLMVNVNADTVWSG